MRFLTPILMLAAAVGMFFLFINPHYKTITELRAQALEYDNAIERAQAVVAKKDQLLAKKNAFNPEDIKRLQKMLPDNVDAVRLIIDLNGLANKYNSSIQDIKLTQDNTQTQQTVGAPTQLYTSSLVGFTVSMNYDQFLSYLKDIEKSLRLLDIAAITFKPEDNSSVYKYGITLKAYALK
jgi:hypothetical protein